MRFETAQLSKTGGRSENQDALGCTVAGEDGSWVLADGLGGHGGGRLVARLAVDTALATLAAGDVSEAALSHCVAETQAALERAGALHAELSGARTTLVLLCARGASASWAHVGDSRLYLLRDRGVLHQTHDHSVPQMLVDAGELSLAAIRTHEDRNRVVRALGCGGKARPAVCAGVPLAVGDAFVLCSDGFWENVLEDEMLSDLEGSDGARDWLERMERRVLGRADDDFDNYSAIGVIVAR